MPKKFSILGVNISAINMQDALLVVRQAIEQKKKIYISVCPVSTIMECQKNTEIFTSVNSADLVTPDGMPIVWLGRLKGHNNIRRVYGPDLMLEVCRISGKRGFKNYFYGSHEQVLNKLQYKLKRLFPGLVVSGGYSPPFRKLSREEDEKIIQMINDSGSDILWVGLGSPKQDLWMNEHRDNLNVPVIIGVGAAFDFLSGAKKQAPLWMQRSALEWLFRLASEPRRLWKRYILGNAKFLFLLMKGLIGKENKEQ